VPDRRTNATKISFVGLSMHDYLNNGFKYLFSDKSGYVQLVVTDTSGAHSSGSYYLSEVLDPMELQPR